MDIVFVCPNCRQELAVEANAAGSQLECPSCGQSIVAPEADPSNIRVANPISTSAAAKEERHFVVPQHGEPAEVLIHKPSKPLDVAAKESDRRLRIKCIKRTECVEVGHDRFDEVVSQFLDKIGEANIVNLMPIVYTHLDIGSQKLMTDYGIMIVYKG